MVGEGVGEERRRKDDGEGQDGGGEKRWGRGKGARS